MLFAASALSQMEPELLLLLQSWERCGESHGAWLSSGCCSTATTSHAYFGVFQCYKMTCLEIAGPAGPKGYRGQKVSYSDLWEENNTKRIIWSHFREFLCGARSWT